MKQNMIIVSGVARGAGFFGRTAVSTMMIRYVTLILLRLWDMSMRWSITGGILESGISVWSRWLSMHAIKVSSCSCGIVLPAIGMTLNRDRWTEWIMQSFVNVKWNGCKVSVWRESRLISSAVTSRRQCGCMKIFWVMRTITDWWWFSTVAHYLADGSVCIRIMWAVKQCWLRKIWCSISISVMRKRSILACIRLSAIRWDRWSLAAAFWISAWTVITTAVQHAGLRTCSSWRLPFCCRIRFKTLHWLLTIWKMFRLFAWTLWSGCPQRGMRHGLSMAIRGSMWCWPVVREIPGIWQL